MKNNIIYFYKNIISIFLIIFFSYTVSNKILKINEFKLNLVKTDFFPYNFIDFVVYIVIIIESISIILLILKTKSGLLYSLIMMLLFSLYISILFSEGKYEVCGCGGILNGLSYEYHISINLTIIILILINLIKNETDKQ